MYASPAYIQEMGNPETLDNISNHRIAAHSIVDTRDILWNHKGKPMGKGKALPSPRWLINDSAALERFAVSGAGLALISTVEGENLATRGELVRVLPEYEQEGATASLVWPTSRHMAPRVRAFIDHAVETMGDAGR
jgi:DNA-binding transcriptional LysR family regulator